MEINTKETLTRLFKDKRVLFITSKNLDYLRNTQEINLISSCCKEIKVIGSPSKKYIVRLIKTYLSLFNANFKQFDFVFFGFAPQLYFPFFFFIKNPIVIDFFISMYDTLVDDRKIVKDNTLMSKFIHKIDKLVLDKASCIIVDTNADKRYFLNEFGLSNEKNMLVLYIEADTSIYNPNLYPKKVRENGCLDVLYFGSILPLQGIEVILDCMKKLRENTNIHFTIIGPISKKYDVEEKEYPNTKFYKWLSQEDLAKEIAKSDICLAGHFSGTIGKANRTIAGKTYIYKAMGKPVILGDSDANHELFNKDSNNYFIPLGDSSSLKQCLLEIYQYK